MREDRLTTILGLVKADLHFKGVPLDPFEAGKQFLELTDHQAVYLFLGNRKLHEIEQFCRDGGIVPGTWV